MIISFVADMLILRIRVRNEWLAMALATIPWSLTWFAIWLLTRPEPGSAGRARRADRTRAWAMRGLATCPYLTFILAMQPSFVRAGWFGEIGEVVLVGLLLCAAPAGFLYYDHLRRAAVRLPAPRLTSQARLLRWLVPGAAALSIGYLVFGRFRGSAGDLLHFLPRPAMPGSADLSFLFDLLLAGLDPTRPSILTRVFSALATLAAVAVLAQFRIAFARAVRASKQPRRM